MQVVLEFMSISEHMYTRRIADDRLYYQLGDDSTARGSIRVAEGVSTRTRTGALSLNRVLCVECKIYLPDILMAIFFI